MIRILLGILVLLSVAAPAVALDTLVVVRHAEKVADWPSTPEMNAFQPLSEEGVARSHRLAERLAEADVVVVVGSPTTRSLHTGLATAAAHACELRVARATIDRAAVADWLRELRAEFPGSGTAVVVGHSNTVPWLLEAAGARPECWAALGVTGDEGSLEIEGYEGLWEIDLAGDGCEAIRRHTLH